jgi:hypothetical protein
MLEPARLERARALLGRARDLTRRLGASFVLLVAPTRPQVESGLSDTLLGTTRVNDWIRVHAQADGISVLDPLPGLKDAAVKGKKLYFPGTGDLSPEGHEVLSAWLAPRIAAALRSR